MSTNDLHTSNDTTTTPRTAAQVWQYHSVKGTLVEMIGHMAGATSWQKRKIQAAETQAYLQGTLDRAQGKFDAVVGAVTGDQVRQMEGTSFRSMCKAPILKSSQGTCATTGGKQVRKLT
ncbi:mismatched base pair and cruciform DNA recognition protein, partial [Mycena olivaceomarginata]